MSESFMFLSEGKMNSFHDKKSEPLTSSMAENYKKKLKEIKNRNEWKKSGTGAMFMGANLMAGEEAELNNERLNINGLSKYGDEGVVYSLNSGNIGGIYLKDVRNPEAPETYIFVKEKIRFYDIDCDRNRIITSVAENFLEKHLAMIEVSSRDFHLLTEGESCDCNPSWSRRNENIVYYDSCGLGYDSEGNFVRYGPKSLYCLNTATGDLTETLAGDKFDFYKPYEDSLGNLYYIKRPYNSGNKQGMTLKDILLMPIRILKAVFGWLNFFTQRYSGESLKTRGNNPAKTRNQSPEQIFIDGNLLEAEKILNQNKAYGERNPGYVPLSWELTVRKPDGEERVLKKGVLDYCVLSDNSMLYSNGKYVIKIHENGTEEKMTKAYLPSNLVDLNIPAEQRQ